MEKIKAIGNEVLYVISVHTHTHRDTLGTVTVGCGKCRHFLLEESNLIFDITRNLAGMHLSVDFYATENVRSVLIKEQLLGVTWGNNRGLFLF